MHIPDWEENVGLWFDFFFPFFFSFKREMLKNIDTKYQQYFFCSVVLTADVSILDLDGLMLLSVTSEVILPVREAAVKSALCFTALL